MIIIWLYVSFSYGWCGRASWVCDERFRWLYWLGSPIFMPIAFIIYLKEFKNDKKRKSSRNVKSSL